MHLESKFRRLALWAETDDEYLEEDWSQVFPMQPGLLSKRPKYMPIEHGGRHLPSAGAHISQSQNLTQENMAVFQGHCHSKGW